MSKNKIKVLHIFSTLPVGGAEILMLNIVKNIDRNRFDIVVSCLGEEGVIGRQIKDYGVEVVSFNSKRIGNLSVPLLCKLRKFVKKGDFDIVHTHMYHANLYGRIAACLAGVPVILSGVHNIYQKRKRHRIFINRVLSKITDRVVVGSSAVMEDVKRYDRVPEEKIEVLPHGIDTDIFMKKHDRYIVRERLGLSLEDYVVGNVARLEEAKGQRFLIDAVRILKDKGLDIKCLIVGSGSLEKELKDLVIKNRIENDVIFLGTRQDLPELFSAMDIFILPSLWEGVPLALLSSMAAGLPVVTTHAGGIRDIVVDGKNGLVVPPSDPLTIAVAIERIFKDTELQKRLSENARREIIQHHSARVMTKRLEELYTSLLNHSRRAT